MKVLRSPEALDFNAAAASFYTGEAGVSSDGATKATKSRKAVKTAPTASSAAIEETMASRGGLPFGFCESGAPLLGGVAAHKKCVPDSSESSEQDEPPPPIPRMRARMPMMAGVMGGSWKDPASFTGGLPGPQASH